MALIFIEIPWTSWSSENESYPILLYQMRLNIIFLCHHPYYMLNIFWIIYCIILHIMFIASRINYVITRFQGLYFLRICKSFEKLDCSFVFIVCGVKFVITGPSWKLKELYTFHTVIVSLIQNSQLWNKVYTKVPYCFMFLFLSLASEFHVCYFFIFHSVAFINVLPLLSSLSSGKLI